MRKQINWLRHFSILFLTIMIFTIGVLIGGDVEQLRVQNLYTQLQEQDLDYQNIVTESNYINYIVDLKEKNESGISCDLIKGSYFNSITSLDTARIKLENYINTGSVKQDEFQRLKGHYSNIQINYWILANRINELCNANMNTVLYFYADKKECPSCDDQGVHLDYVKKKLGDNFLVFSFDSQTQGPVQVLGRTYELYNKELPLLVIDNKIYGFTNNEEISNILCKDGLNNSICEEK